MYCYPVPHAVAKVTKHVWRPIRRAYRHHVHTVWGTGITIVCVGSGAELWKLIPPTNATPVPLPDVAVIAVPEPSSLLLLVAALGIVMFIRKVVR